jgi:hypothetical protein
MSTVLHPLQGSLSLPEYLALGSRRAANFSREVREAHIWPIFLKYEKQVRWGGARSRVCVSCCRTAGATSLPVLMILRWTLVRPQVSQSCKLSQTTGNQLLHQDPHLGYQNSMLQFHT